jgi:CspA family cold shock protein
MAKGTVKWFDSRKGYGFISYEGSDTDVFVHSSALTGTISLNEGDTVEFDIVQRDRGPAARDVTKVGA